MNIYRFPTQSEIKTALKRPEINPVDLDQLVQSIFKEIQVSGDEAVRAYSRKFDGIELTHFRVTQEEIERAMEMVPQDLKEAIQVAAANIERFHASQKEEPVRIETMPGVVCWRKPVGIERVGLYIPGGTAPLFSTVLMLGVPARLAGCKRVVLCTPCGKEGSVHPAILYTANLIGISEIFKVGGIQAIAAMSLGTETIPAVYKLFGPGNQYVTAAKQYAQRLGLGIDMPAGPSEVMVVADETGNPAFIAADLLSQAEHGADSQVVFVTTDPNMPLSLEREIQQQLLSLPRGDIARQALENSSILVVKKEQLLPIINEYAPEHLILQTDFNSDLVEGLVNAGSVFLGKYTPESAGDYASGTNHTLPTNGYARQFSGVSLDSFVKKITFQEITKVGIQGIGPILEVMAAAEGLEAHKNAATLRLRSLL